MKSIKWGGFLLPVIFLLAVATMLISDINKPGTDVFTYEEYHRSNFQAESPSGLSSQTTYNIIKDRAGFIWVSTRNGIDRYDGATFEHYRIGEARMRGIRDGMMITLYQDQEGDIWAFTERSIIYRFIPKEDAFVEVLNLPKSNIWGSTQALFRQGDLLLAGATDGIIAYDLEKKTILKRFCPDDNVRCLTAYKDGQVLFGSQRGIGVINLEQLRGKLMPWANTSINTLHYESDDNRIWVGGNGTGIYILDPEEPEDIQFVTGSEGFLISEFCPFDDAMLMAADGSGVWRSKKSMNNYANTLELIASDTPDAPYQITSSSVRSVMADDNIIWIAMFIGGISYIQPPSTLIQLSNKEGASPSDQFAQGVSTDRDGNIWVAFEQGIAQYDATGGNPISYLHHEAHFLTVLPADDGTIWCGGFNSGLYHFDPKTGWREHFPSIVGNQNNDGIYMIKQDSYGDIWVGGLNFPLTRLHYADRKILDKKSYDELTFVTELEWLSPDTIIVGTTDGIMLIDTKTDVQTHLLTEDEGWTGTNYVSAITPRHGHEIWIATQGAGIVCYDLNNKQQPISTFNQDHGLPSLELRGMEMLNDSVLCISTEGNGIFAFDCNKQSFVRGLRKSDGLRSDHFQQAASTSGKEGRIIFGGDQGAVVIKASDLLSKQHNFSIYVVGKGVENNQVHLPYNARNLDIQFTTNDIYRQHEYSFYYHIPGIMDEWQTIDDSRHVRFAQLPAGNYQLEIRAVSGANQTSSLCIDVDVEQEPWLRWYAILAYILVIIALTTIVNAWWIFRHKED